MAMMGRLTSLMAFLVASSGLRPLAMCRSTFSTTTMESSTTMPMASTRPNSDSVLMEKPSAYSTANVPMMDTGTATSGMIEARQVCRNRMTTSTTSATASSKVCDHGVDGLAHELRRVVDDLVVHALRETLLESLHVGADLVGELERVGARRLVDRNGHGVLVAEQRTAWRRWTRRVPGARCRAGARLRRSSPVLTTTSPNCFLVLEAALGIERQLEFGARGGRRADLAGGHLHVLFADGARPRRRW